MVKNQTPIIQPSEVNGLQLLITSPITDENFEKESIEPSRSGFEGRLWCRFKKVDSSDFTMLQVVGGKRTFSFDQLDEFKLVLNDLNSRKKRKIAEDNSLNKELDFLTKALSLELGIPTKLVSTAGLRSANREQ